MTEGIKRYDDWAHRDFDGDPNSIEEYPNGRFVLASDCPTQMNSVDKLKDLMRRCKCGVYVSVNDHRNIHESAEIFLSDMSIQNDERDFEIEPEVKAKMIETDTIVHVQFYPSTPIGSYSIHHYDLDAALDLALGCFDDAAGEQK